MAPSEVVPFNQPQSVQTFHGNGTVRSASILANPEQVKINMRAAELFAQSDLVPAHYRGKPANCFIAINRAQRLGVDEMFFLERTFVVGGRLGMAAELAIELANGSGRFRGPIRFRLFGEGDARGCTAYASLAADGELVENTVTYAMAKADGWTRNNKWNSLRDQMLQYRAGVFLARLYAAGAMGGMYTRDELEDIVAIKEAPPDQIEQQEKQEQKVVEKTPLDVAVELEVRLKTDIAAVEDLEQLDDLYRGNTAEIKAAKEANKRAYDNIVAMFSSRKKEIVSAAEQRRQDVIETPVEPLVEQQEPTMPEQATADTIDEPWTIDVPKLPNGDYAWDAFVDEMLRVIATIPNDDWGAKFVALHKAQVAALSKVGGVVRNVNGHIQTGKEAATQIREAMQRRFDEMAPPQAAE